MTVLQGGLIGHHISRTRLPAALQIMCDEAGLQLDFELIDTAALSEFDFAGTVETMRHDGWSGVTVTHPYKTDARALAGSGMVPAVAHLGAANTLIFGADLAGHNTDYTGFKAAMAAQGLTPSGSVLIMGAGGVAQALAPALAELMPPRGQVFLCDTDPQRAHSLAATVGPRGVACSPDDVRDVAATCDGLVNATPLGMAEYPGSAFAPDMVTGGARWAFDAVYTPTRTRFLAEAEAAGLTCLTGFDLFRAMAVRSFEAYTGLTVDQTTILPRLDALKPE